MKRTIIILAAILVSGCGVSKMEIATDLLLVADWAQTRQIPDRPDVIEKKNIFLGENPTKQSVEYYFAGALVANTLIHRKWPWSKAERIRKKLLPTYQGGLVGVQVSCIERNYYLGLQVEF